MVAVIGAFAFVHPPALVDTESVVGSFLPMMETIPYLTKEPDGFSYAMEPQDVLYGLGGTGAQYRSGSRPQ